MCRALGDAATCSAVLFWVKVRLRVWGLPAYQSAGFKDQVESFGLPRIQEGRGEDCRRSQKEVYELEDFEEPVFVSLRTRVAGATWPGA